MDADSSENHQPIEKLIIYTQTQKDHRLDGLFALTWQLLTFPGPCGPSIISPGGLNFRVRDGNGWNPSGIVTRSFLFESCSLKTAQTILTVSLIHLLLLKFEPKVRVP